MTFFLITIILMKVTKCIKVLTDLNVKSENVYPAKISVFKVNRKQPCQAAAPDFLNYVHVSRD